MNKIKVAHILHCVGGVDVYLRLILSNINSDNFSNIIIHGNDDTSTKFENDKGEGVIEYKRTIVRNIHVIKDLKAIYSIYKVLKKEKPDIIHCHSAKGGIIGRVVGRILKINVLFTPHAFSYLSADSKFKRYIYLLIERYFANNNSFLLATSNSELNRGSKDVKYKKENVLLFNNSINPINSVKDLTIQKTWPNEYICTVGRPSYQKNIELMIRVLSEVRKTNNIHLVVMGVGHHSDKLDDVKKLIIELNLSDSVTLIDWTNRHNILNIINNSKFYISTARYEGLPYSVIESLALGKPCIVSNCDGNRDLIINDFNGYVIQDENINKFAEKISLLWNDKIILKKLSENSKTSFEENFNIEKNIVKLQEIYRYVNKC